MKGCDRGVSLCTSPPPPKDWDVMAYAVQVHTVLCSAECRCAVQCTSTSVQQYSATGLCPCERHSTTSIIFVACVRPFDCLPN